MATVLLPLSSFSRKILLAEYGGTEPIEPGRADWLSDVLRVDRSDTRFPARAIDALNSSLMLVTTPAVADHISAQGKCLGVVLHRHHIEMLTRAMLAVATAGGAAKTAMQTFFDTYDLDDDDLSQESAYREYQRFRRNFFKKMQAKAAKKSRPDVLRDSRIWQGSGAETGACTNTELDALCAVASARIRAARIRRIQRISFQAHLYIYAVRGGRDVAAIARRFRRHKANVYRALATVRRRLRHDRRFAEAILPLLDAGAVLPGPAAAAHICANSPKTEPV